LTSCKQSVFPIRRCVCTISQRIHSITVKTLPGDIRKIECIQDLILRHVAIPRLLEKIGCAPE
jgi:hypothetical protein